jgi:hypothetical protein
MKLPGWVVDNRSEVLREAEDYIGMPIERRFEILDALCREAVDALANREDREKVLWWQDRPPRTSARRTARSMSLSLWNPPLEG